MEKIDGWTGSSLIDAGDHFLGISTWESKKKHDAATDLANTMFQNFVPFVTGQPDRKVGTLVAAASAARGAKEAAEAGIKAMIAAAMAIEHER